MRKSLECCDAAKKLPGEVLRAQLSVLTEQSGALLSAIDDLGDGLGSLENALFRPEPCESQDAEKPFEPLAHDNPVSALVERLASRLDCMARGLAAEQKRLDAIRARV